MVCIKGVDMTIICKSATDGGKSRGCLQKRREQMWCCERLLSHQKCFKRNRVQQKKIHKCFMNALIFQIDIQAVLWLA